MFIYTSIYSYIHILFLCVYMYKREREIHRYNANKILKKMKRKKQFLPIFSLLSNHLYKIIACHFNALYAEGYDFLAKLFKNSLSLFFSSPNYHHCQTFVKNLTMVTSLYLWCTHHNASKVMWTCKHILHKIALFTQ